MRIGLLLSSIGNFGKKGFYNAQEIGLAKELGNRADEVILYKLVPMNEEEKNEKIVDSRTASIHTIPSKTIGTSGLFDVEQLDKDLDALIYFSDTQLMVPRVAQWTRKYGVPLYPYIGVTESHSTNLVFRSLLNLLFRKNLAVYKTVHCFAKTPDVEKRLRDKGVKNVTVAPVGLDLSLLHKDYESVSQSALKVKYGYQKWEKVLLFIGRFVKEKQPERMITIFDTLYQKDDSYRLLMVGTGELRYNVENKVEQLGLAKQVKFVDRIPNSDIWELYRLADTFVNLNQQEIFGMAILEAMYYGCKVVAWHAPGPDTIIDSPYDGVLCNSDGEIVEAIMNCPVSGNKAHKKIEQSYLWRNTADKMISLIEREGMWK